MDWRRSLWDSDRFSPVLTGSDRWRGSVGLTPPVACLAAVSGLPVVLLPGEQRTEARCPCGAEQGVEPRPRQTQDPHHDKLLEMHSTRGLQSDLQNPSESFSFVAFSYIFLYFVARCMFFWNWNLKCSVKVNEPIGQPQSEHFRSRSVPRNRMKLDDLVLLVLQWLQYHPTGPTSSILDFWNKDSHDSRWQLIVVGADGQHIRWKLLRCFTWKTLCQQRTLPTRPGVKPSGEALVKMLAAKICRVHFQTGSLYTYSTRIVYVIDCAGDGA